MQPYQYGQSPFLQQPSALRMRFGPRTIAALVMTIVALVFVILAIATPWWTMKYSLTLPYSYGSLQATDNYFLGGGCESATMFSSQMSGCSSYGSQHGALGGAFGLAYILMIIGLILMILALSLLLVSALRPRVGIVAAICAFIGSILVLIAPIYVFVVTPGAFTSAMSSYLGSLLPGYGVTISWGVTGFFGSGPIVISASGTTLTGQSSYWGDIGWFIAFVAFVLVLISAVMILIAVRALMPLGNYRTIPMMPYGYYPSPFAGQGAAGSWPSLPGYPPQQPQMAYPVQPYPYGQVTSATPPVQQPQQPQPPLTEPTSTTPSQQPTPTEPKPPSTCPSCGSPLSPDIVFCPACGAKVR